MDKENFFCSKGCYDKANKKIVEVNKENGKNKGVFKE